MTNRMDNYHKFFGNENISIIWSAITDGLNLQKTDSNYSTIVNIFNGNIQMFKRTADFSNSIVLLNKQFIKQVLVAVKALNVNVKKLQINREEVVMPVKFLDIQNNRRNEIESQYLQQKHERESIISQKPPEIDFSDNFVNAKITEEEINSLLKLRNEVDITTKSKKVSFNDIVEDILSDEEIVKNGQEYENNVNPVGFEIGTTDFTISSGISQQNEIKYGEQLEAPSTNTTKLTGGFISNHDTVEWLKMLNDKLDLIIKHFNIEQ